MVPGRRHSRGALPGTEMLVRALLVLFALSVRRPRSRRRCPCGRPTTKSFRSRPFSRPSKPRFRPWIGPDGSSCSRRPPIGIRPSSSSKPWCPRASPASSSRSAIARRFRARCRAKATGWSSRCSRDRAARPHRDLASRHPPPARGRDRPPAVAHPRARPPRVDRRTASSVAPHREAVRGAQPRAEVDRFRAAGPGRRCLRGRDAGGRDRAGDRRRRHDAVSTRRRRKSAGSSACSAGGESLETPFTAAFVRLNPFEFEQRVARGMLEPAALDPRAFRRGLAVFDEGVPKSFNLDLSDLSRDVWSLLPQPGDFVAEVRTRRFDQLTFARSSGEAEDVTLFQRARKRNIAAYASEHKLAQPRPLLRRRQPRRLRHPRLRHRCRVLPRARVARRPHPDQAAGHLARPRRAHAQARREPERDVGHERRVRPAAVPAGAQPEQRASSTCRRRSRAIFR